MKKVNGFLQAYKFFQSKNKQAEIRRRDFVILSL